jgi:hypothetical protein
LVYSSSVVLATEHQHVKVACGDVLTIKKLDVSEKFTLIEPREFCGAVDVQLVRMCLVVLAGCFCGHRLLSFLSLHGRIGIVLSFSALSRRARALTVAAFALTITVVPLGILVTLVTLIAASR